MAQYSRTTTLSVFHAISLCLSFSLISSIIWTASTSFHRTGVLELVTKIRTNNGQNPRPRTAVKRDPHYSTLSATTSSSSSDQGNSSTCS